MWCMLLTIAATGGILYALYYLLALVLCFKWNTPRRNYELAKKLPGPKVLPIIGMALEIASKKPHEIIPFLEKILKWDPFINFRNLGYLIVLTKNPDHVEEILKSIKYIPKGLEYFPILPWLGTGLLTSKGEKWTARRKMLTPTFHFEILEQYLPIINQNVVDLCDKLSSHVFSDINLVTHVSNLTLNIIVETAMGTKLKGKGGEEYIKAVNKMCDLMTLRAQDPILYHDTFFYFSWAGYQTRKCLKTVHQFTENVIKERRAEYLGQKQKYSGKSESIKKRKAFLDFLIEFSETDPTSMTDKDIREEVDTFMFEGHDTTSMSLCWTLYLLAANQDIQDKVVSEIEDIFGSLECNEIQIEHLKKMEYLEKVIKESLRLYPSVPYFSRWLEHDLQLGEFTIPAQSNIAIVTYWLHRNPESFPDPEKFDPERFSKENSAERHPFAYIPFSAGPRNCIGQRFALMEEKVVLTQLLRKFKFEAIPNQDKVRCYIAVVLRPLENNLQVRIVPRSSH
uniref:Cytochrome P450 4C1 n=1 Tax=Cacopsylla melanoneura TaxID=428564 RepID=A0A8D8LUU7_9HEMI